MDTVQLVVIVGKPGAGKSSLGAALSAQFKGTYVSLGSFMRNELGIPDPHIGVDKQPVYTGLHERYVTERTPNVLVLDCHPYPQEDLAALQSFINQPSVELLGVIEVDADDEIALARLERRPRPGQTYRERLQYYADNRHYIEQLLQHPLSIRITNNTDSTEEDFFESLAKKIIAQLRNPRS